jgi:hypothetical protein
MGSLSPITGRAPSHESPGLRWRSIADGEKFRAAEERIRQERRDVQVTPDCIGSSATAEDNRTCDAEEKELAEDIAWVTEFIETYKKDSDKVAYRRSLDELLALTDAMTGPESLEAPLLDYLEDRRQVRCKWEEVYRLRRVAYETSATADEKNEWDVQEKEHTEKIAELGTRIIKERGCEAKRHDREDWFIAQDENTRGVIPVTLQMMYWVISAFVIASYQLYLGGLTTYCTCWLWLLVGLTALSLPHFLFDQLWVRLYWYGLFGLAAAAGHLVSPCMNTISRAPLNARESIAVYFCLAFVFISEAEWWRYLRANMLHPIFVRGSAC